MKLLRAEESRQIDMHAAAHGLSEQTLICNAGRRAAQIIHHYYRPCRVHLLCGTGNNGADGLVAARHLLEAGFDARVFLLGTPKHKNLWRGKTYPLSGASQEHDRAELIVDALFGTGLSRPLSDDLATLAHTLTQPVIALDVPSGIYSDDGRSGGDRSGGRSGGGVFKAERTIAFFRPHPSHFLLPAADYCGQVILADIGLPEDFLNAINPKISLNQKPTFKHLPTDIHKYQRGSVLIVGGGFEKQGAARLAARAALRIGAGLVTLNLPEKTALTDISIMSETLPLEESLADGRRNVVLLGPGNGVSERTKHNVLYALSQKPHIVLDADALTLFESEPQTLFAAIKNKKQGVVILTPHQGEYRRLFPEFMSLPKIVQAQKAAVQSGAMILLKGSDSIIATPSGEVIINAAAPPDLATAGSGDVLAGMIAGLLAQNNAQHLNAQPLDAIAAACYLHAAAAQDLGVGLIAEDLPDHLPKIMRDYV